MGKHKHFKVKGFLIFSYEAEISMQFQNHGKSGFHTTRKEWENTNISNL